MAQDHMRLQKMVAHNANEAQDYMKDISDWTSEMESKENREQNVALALEHKELGNKFMREKNYWDAILSYEKGLQVDPKNAVLYSNRAQAYLHLKQYQLTVNDCTRALELNSPPVNVKALYRRAKAYVELKQLNLAQEDLRSVLKLDPKNSEAKQKLQELSSQVNPATRPTKKFHEKQALNLGYLSPEKEFSPEKQGHGDVGEFPKIINPIDKPLHLRSKRVTLPVPVRVCGQEVGSKRNSMSSLPSSVVTTPVSPVAPTTADIAGRGDEIMDVTQELDLSTVEIPSKPTTAAQFMSTWKILKENPVVCGHYLNKLEPQDYAIFQDAMDLATLSEILTLLQWEFLPRKWPFTHHLEGLLKVRRLATLFMLMTEKDKAHARNLISRCTSDELRSYYNENFII